MTFEWDHEKADENRRKHDVHFSDVLGVFSDPSAIEFLDEEHSSEREPGVIRILHARRADAGW